MHGIHASLARRLEAVARRLGSILPPETTDQIDRRAALVRAAHLDLVPADLREDERAVFSKIRASNLVFQELIDEGIIDAYGQPSGGDDDDGDDHRDLDDLDDDPHAERDEPVWRP